MKENTSFATWFIAIAAKIVLPLISLAIMVLIGSNLMFGKTVGDINAVNDFIPVFVCFCLPMFISLAVLPCIYELIFNGTKASEIGLVFKPTKFNLILLVANILIAIVAIYLLSMLKIEGKLGIIVSFVFVAFCEELMTRGIIMHTLQQRLKWLPSAIICSIAFAFVYHSGDDFAINATWRLPLGFILSLVTLKANNIYQSSLLHFNINMLINTIWFV